MKVRLICKKVVGGNVHRPAYRAGMDGVADPSRVPANKPAFRSLVADNLGYLWVFPSMHSDDKGTLIDIFDLEGRYLGQVGVPDSLSMSPRPVVQRDKLYAVMSDELDVPYVVRYQIHGRP